MTIHLGKREDNSLNSKLGVLDKGKRTNDDGDGREDGATDAMSRS